ncbi:zinc finger BED domain-containing protein 1-like [Rhizophagus irregularis DAOM 181602=DAOM 197198]|nr:zinc finger BED domain-containing protein 1-like [Rhizophagus irregularis DAOM 181602=DAOM 197198]
MPDEKGIKKVIYGAYNFILPTLIEKLKVNAKSVSIIGQGYIGVTYSYIDMKFNLNEITLTVNYVKYSYTAQHITESLKEILKEWNLYDKVFTITTDNTANIKRAIANIKNISWQRFSAYTIQLIVEKVLVPAKVLIVQVKQLIEFFMRPK